MNHIYIKVDTLLATAFVTQLKSSAVVGLILTDGLGVAFFPNWFLLDFYTSKNIPIID